MHPKKIKQPVVIQNVSGDNNIVVTGDVSGNVIVGDNNTVNQTIIQKFFNIFRSDAETTDQRNRRIMLGHVENFWVKVFLETEKPPVVPPDGMKLERRRTYNSTMLSSIRETASFLCME